MAPRTAAHAATTTDTGRSLNAAAGAAFIGHFFDSTGLLSRQYWRAILEPIEAPRFDLSRAGRFSHLVSIARNTFGLEVADRLLELRNARLSTGEHRLRLDSVRVALRFAMDNRWPLGALYSTPTGNIQCSWYLRSGGRVVARFSPRDRVSFAVLQHGAVTLAGEDTAVAFGAMVSRFREQLVQEEAVGESDTISETESEEQGSFRVLASEPATHSSLLSPGEFEQVGSADGISFSTEST